MVRRAASGSRFAGSPAVTLGAASATTPFLMPTVRQRRFGDLTPAGAAARWSPDPPGRVRAPSHYGEAADPPG